MPLRKKDECVMEGPSKEEIANDLRRAHGLPVEKPVTFNPFVMWLAGLVLGIIGTFLFMR